MENVDTLKFFPGTTAADPVTVNLEGAAIGTLEQDTDGLWKFNPAGTAPLTVLVIEAIRDQLTVR